MADTTTPNIGSFNKPSEGMAAIKNFAEGVDQGSIYTPSHKKPEKKETKPKKTDYELATEETELEKTIRELEKAPELTYAERLEKNGITQKEADEIVDTLMMGEEYQRTYQITKKYNVTFRTRKFKNQERVLDFIESVNPQFPASVGNIVSKHNLAASLVRFRDIDFNGYKEKDKLDWIENLPDIIANVLARKLAKFDQMILDVLDEGAIENF